MKYSKIIPPKDKLTIQRGSRFFGDFDIGYYLDAVPPNMEDTKKAVKKLRNRPPMNWKLISSGDDIKSTFLKLFNGNIHIAELIELLANESRFIIMKLKWFHNRPRPQQVAKSMNYPFPYCDLKSSRTPAYPSGHSTQAFLIAEVLSWLFPNMKEELLSNAKMISVSRLNARIHYPSDTNIGEKLGSEMGKHFLNKIKKPNIELPFFQIELSERKVIRKFPKNIKKTLLKWHTDAEERIVHPLNESGWQLQYDNKLPKILGENKIYKIPKGLYHRTIKGTKDLVIAIEK